MNPPSKADIIKYQLSANSGHLSTELRLKTNPLTETRQIPLVHTPSMSPSTVFTRGVRIVAGLHHSHGVKAAMSLLRLRGLFPNWTDDSCCRRFSTLGGSKSRSSRVRFRTAIDNTKASEVLLARAVVPAYYGATRVWVDAPGLNAVVSNYFEQACADPGYLGHRLSILLALQEAWPLYRDGSDRLLFLDRLAEFILACRFVPEYDQVSVESATRDAALSAALARPGFFRRT